MLEAAIEKKSRIVVPFENAAACCVVDGDQRIGIGPKAAGDDFKRQFLLCSNLDGKTVDLRIAKLPGHGDRELALDAFKIGPRR